MYLIRDDTSFRDKILCLHLGGKVGKIFSKNQDSMLRRQRKTTRIIGNTDVTLKTAQLYTGMAQSIRSRLESGREKQKEQLKNAENGLQERLSMLEQNLQPLLQPSQNPTIKRSEVLNFKSKR